DYGQIAQRPLRLPPSFGKNQHIPIDGDVKEQLKKVLLHFDAPIQYALAYGSGVFPQKGYDSKSKPMIDFIFGVNYTQHWHSLNRNQHRDHYSLVGSLGSRALASIQENFGAGIYFNPFIEIDGMTIKYGVVSIDTICKDLLDWETLYVAGRMHKPVKILRDDARVRLANQVNLANALRTALLLLPKEFSEKQLYLAISGDFRSVVGENPKKLENIVSDQMHHFRLLYGGLIDGMPNVGFVRYHKLQQDDSIRARSQLIQNLPRALRAKLKEEHRMALVKKGQALPSDNSELYRSIAAAPEYRQYIVTALKETVRRPAITQSVKGILTAGLSKSIRYTSRKLGKWIKAK
ncbi:5236_t:CDS:2, partial [Paraglomus brasilianum]